MGITRHLREKCKLAIAETVGARIINGVRTDEGRIRFYEKSIEEEPILTINLDIEQLEQLRNSLQKIFNNSNEIKNDFF